ncbi:hypothetical protein [Turneriella parva]|uniref:hypothetical protein n=1 Tax=Turneriella parva TaxID=29510 RepID=UPI000308B054|nr:hypothetical protein [Turneriella parva]
MFWLRSSLLYLGVTALIGGAIWLFWGKTIETEWKKFTAANPEVKKAQVQAEKKVKAAVPKEVKAPPVPANAKAEWNKAKSGAVTLIDLHANESRRETAASLAAHDRRTLELMALLRIKGQPGSAPDTSPTSAPPVKAPAPETTKPLKKPEKNKPLKPMI